jgi:hypothetical protein
VIGRGIFVGQKLTLHTRIFPDSAISASKNQL